MTGNRHNGWTSPRSIEAVADDHIETGGDVTLADMARTLVIVHPRAIRRAVGNLIENARKYGERAQVSLVSDHATASLIVEDDGPGIAEGRIEEMLQPFTRLERLPQPRDGRRRSWPGDRASRRHVGRLSFRPHQPPARRPARNDKSPAREINRADLSIVRARRALRVYSCVVFLCVVASVFPGGVNALR